MSVSKLEGANVKITLGGVEVGTGVGDLRNDTDAFVRAVMRDDSRAGKACGVEAFSKILASGGTFTIPPRIGHHRQKVLAAMDTETRPFAPPPKPPPTEDELVLAAVYGSCEQCGHINTEANEWHYCSVHHKGLGYSVEGAVTKRVGNTVHVLWARASTT